jgi:translation initiation factor IF-3
MSRLDALNAAKEQDLDLVEVSPGANPPVAKIIDWGKYNYQRTKQLQKNKKNAKVIDLKQIRLGLKIDDHDIMVKLNKVNGFLKAGHKVKFTIFYRGRELAHKDIGFKLSDKIIDYLGDSVIIDQKPQFSGKQLIFVVRSNTNAKN